MRKLKFLIVGICLFSCQKVEVLTFEMKELSEQACHENLCATVDLSYPFYLGSSELSSYLNGHIEQQLLMMAQVGESLESESIGLAISDFLNDYLQFMNEFEDANHEWSLEIKARQTFQGSELVSIVFENFSYTGGAHPNYHQQFVNFSKKTNALISNKELILNENKLLQIAEKKFKEYFELNDEDDLTEDDRFFLEDGFVLPLTMGYDGSEFILFYNPYEIGPYVLGATELRFSREEIRDVVRVFE